MKKARKRNIQKPHDHYFRQAMSHPQVAREFFENHLPSELLQQIDLNHLEPYPESFIDDNGNESIVDMLFKTKFTNKDILLYLLAEHQSTPSKLMPVRVLRYQLNAITHHMKVNHTDEVPLIIPIVVYHGKARWNFSNDIKDLIKAPRWMIDKYFLQPFQLIDLNKMDDEVLKNKIWSGIMELTLKHIFAKDFLPYLPEIVSLLKQIHSISNNFTEKTLFYIFEATEISDKDKFYDIISENLGAETGDKIMTIPEQLRAECIQQGLYQGQRILIERMLSKGLNNSEIAKLTDLSLDEIRSIKLNSSVEIA